MGTHDLSIPRFLTALLLLAGFAGAGTCIPALASEPQSSGIAGRYSLSGVSRDRSTYDGEVRISGLGGALFWLEWRDSDSSYTGKGALVGDTLYAVWGSEAAGCAVVFFTLAADGTLDGFWFPAQDRDSKQGRMVAAPSAGEEGGLEGLYEVEAEALGDQGFPPDLRVETLGDGYFRFRWQGPEPRDGIGQLDEDQIQVVVSPAAGEGQCGKSRMTVAADGSLSGTWMINDDDYRIPGRETMVPLR